MTVRRALIASMLSASCAHVPSTGSIAQSPGTGLEAAVVHSEERHDHPREMQARDMESALFASGSFLDEDVKAFAVPIARAFSRLKPDEMIHIGGGGVDYALFVSGLDLIIVRSKAGVEDGRTRRRIQQGGEAEGVAQAAVQQAKESSPAGVGRVFSFAAGVSRYKDAAISLEYADRDAASIDAFFASEEGGALPKERRTLLVNDHATRSSILSSLTQISRRASSDDLVVLYLALHGLPDEGGELYFLAYDTDPRQLIGTGLPQRDVEYALMNSPAKRIVMLLDACHAGAAGLASMKSRRGIVLAETNRLLLRLADSKPGVAVLTAASATEASNEGAQWGGGHGVFTHFLLKGLQGGADADRDGVVTVRELFDFVYGRVSDETKGGQHPELKGSFDNRMPLAIRPR
jgi:uncharacterized caspase-like protein